MSSGSPELHLSSGLTIGYGSPLAEANDAIELSSGTHFLIARNGRGKTTLLRTIAKSTPKMAGEIKTLGKMQYLAEDLSFDGELTAAAIFKAMIPSRFYKSAMELADRIELNTKINYNKLSTGNRRKTHLIMAEFSTDPKEANILLLDEPFSGLDAYSRQQFEAIWKNRSENTLRLVSCHPDYDSMQMQSTVLISDGKITHTKGESQTWNQLKDLLN